MRENNIERLSGDEVVRVTTNLERIESLLGHPISTGIVDINKLKDEMLSPADLNRMVVNISRIESTRRNNSKGHSLSDFIVAIILLVGITGIIKIIELVLGWSLL